jgi:hypothetical protein
MKMNDDFGITDRAAQRIGMALLVLNLIVLILALRDLR